MNRRKTISVIGSVLLVPGCAASASGPNPEIEDVDGESHLVGDDEFQVLVTNDGDRGEVLVTVNLFDGDDNMVASQSKKVTLDEDQTKQVTINMDAPDGTEFYEASVEAL